MNQAFTVETKGRVRAYYKDTGEVVLDKDNAIHRRNMALALARGLANEPDHQVFRMSFGNGGTIVEPGPSGSYQYHYNPANVVFPDATLYNETYSEVVDDANSASDGNQVVSTNGTVANTFLVVCTCTLTANQPNDQPTSDDPPIGDSVPTEESYAFDEIGLKTEDGLLLSHLIFAPINKTSNRELVVEYTLTVSVS